jgi:hypothetical protein
MPQDHLGCTNGTFLPNERFLTERTGRKAMLAPSPNPQLLDCDD